jgi:hypothetical protein
MTAIRWTRACAACLLATVWMGAGPPDDSPKPTRRGYSIFDFEEFKGVGGLPGFVPQGWYARLDTDKGPIVAKLLPDQAPQSVAHFAALAQGRLEWAP